MAPVDTVLNCSVTGENAVCQHPSDSTCRSALWTQRKAHILATERRLIEEVATEASRLPPRVPGESIGIGSSGNAAVIVRARARHPPCFWPFVLAAATSQPALWFHAVAEMSAAVFVIDDDPGVREALGSLLRSVGLQPHLHGSDAEFLKAARPDVPSCLVLDVRLPGQGGLDFQRELTQAGIFLPIIFITGHGDIPMSVQAMKGGAIEFMTKPFRDQDLLDAVQVGLERDRVRREREKVLALLRTRFDSLTQREREVMALVVKGRLNKQIAGDIGVSEITVKVHRASVMRKMAALTLADLVLMAEKLKGSAPREHG